jgi:DNA-binding IclR family transcriptional regulator
MAKGRAAAVAPIRIPPSRRSEMEQVSRKQASGSVLKALEVIEGLAYARQPLTLSELAEIVQRPAPTVHRFLRTLQLRDYVETVDGRYRLTLKMFDIGSAVAESVDIIAEARQVCEELCKELGETVNMALRAGSSAVHVVFKVESSRSVRVLPQPGMHVPLHCTGLGKVLLAYLEPDRQLELLSELKLERKTRNTITDRPALEKELHAVVARGWATDDEEWDDWLVCIAAPVFDRHGLITAAISVTAPTARLPRRERPRIAAKVRAAADRISERLGYRA